MPIAPPVKKPHCLCEDWGEGEKLAAQPAPSFLARLQSMPPLKEEGLWPAQITAINNLEKYIVQRLQGNQIDTTARVCICTIQRLYSMLRGRDLSPDLEEVSVGAALAAISAPEPIEYRQRFSVAHEVAHAIFDSDEGVLLTYESISGKYDAADLREIRANSFASHFLMPVSMLKGLPELDAGSAKHWAQQFRVSTAALAKAMKDAGLVDEAAAKRIRAVRVPMDDKIDPEAPEHLAARQRERRKALLERGLSNHYVDLCFKAHDRALISTARLAEMLRVGHAELPEIGALYGRTVSHGV